MDNKMKKGFTLVELAIVLVVIGILLGMAIKGKSLMDAAQMRSDVNKLQKLTSGYAIYYSKYDKAPGDGSTPWSIMDNLTKDGTLSDSDFVSKLGGGYWAFVKCSSGNDGTLWTIPTAAADKAVNMCVTLVADKPKQNDAALTAAQDKMTPKFACYIETMLDNKNVNTGDGRGTVSNQPVVTVGADDTWDCSEQSDGTTNAKPYLYKIF